MTKLQRLASSLLLLLSLAMLFLFPAAGQAKYESQNQKERADQSPSPQLQEAEELDRQVRALRKEGKYKAAFPLALRALTLREQALGKEHESLVFILHCLGKIYSEEKKKTEADTYFARALLIADRQLEHATPDLYDFLEDYAERREQAGAASDAERYYRRALAVKEKLVGLDHPDLTRPLGNLAVFYLQESNRAGIAPEKAIPYYERQIAIEEKQYGGNSKKLIHRLATCSCVLRQSGRIAEAKAMEQRADELQKTGTDDKDEKETDPNILTGRATQKVAPKYPKEAKQQRAEGSVLIEVTINENGKVIDAHLFCGHPLLAKAALEAARKWLFVPTMLKGVPVKVSGLLTFNFRLQ